MHGKYSSSVPQKLFLTINHVAALAVVAWLLFGGGLETVSGVLAPEIQAGDLARRVLLLACSLGYFARMAFLAAYLLRRSVGWVRP